MRKRKVHEHEERHSDWELQHLIPFYDNKWWMYFRNGIHGFFKYLSLPQCVLQIFFESKTARKRVLFFWREHVLQNIPLANEFSNFSSRAVSLLILLTLLLLSNLMMISFMELSYFPCSYKILKSIPFFSFLSSSSRKEGNWISRSPSLRSQQSIHSFRCLWWK